MPPKRKVAEEDIEVWCHKHWDPIIDTRVGFNPINGTAATEFLFRRFTRDIEKDPIYLRDVAGGMTEAQARNKALANLAPLCCLYGDDSVKQLREACRYDKIAKKHPHMNDADDPKGQHHWMPDGSPLL